MKLVGSTRFLPAVLLGLMPLPVLGWTAAQPPPQADRAAVVFLPWMDDAARLDRLAAAGAMPLREAGFSFIWIVTSAVPDLPLRLRRAGLPVLLAADLVPGCGPAPNP